MKKHLSMALSLTVVMTGLCSNAHGWGADGHRITAEIAWRLLAPEARGAVTQLLGGESLPEVSTWADEIRRRPEGQGTAPSHYLNV